MFVLGVFNVSAYHDVASGGGRGGFWARSGCHLAGLDYFLWFVFPHPPPPPPPPCVSSPSVSPCSVTLGRTESGGMGLVAYAAPASPAAALRDSVLCLLSDIHSLLVNTPSSTFSSSPPSSSILASSEYTCLCCRRLLLCRRLRRRRRRRRRRCCCRRSPPTCRQASRGAASRKWRWFWLSVYSLGFRVRPLIGQHPEFDTGST